MAAPMVYAIGVWHTRRVNSRLTGAAANPERRHIVRQTPEDPFCHVAKREAQLGVPCAASWRTRGFQLSVFSPQLLMPVPSARRGTRRPKLGRPLSGVIRVSRSYQLQPLAISFWSHCSGKPAATPQRQANPGGPRLATSRSGRHNFGGVCRIRANP